MAKRPRRKTRLETWLNGVQTPVFLLSAARRVEFFNAGCEAETGWSAEEVLGEVCEYVSEADHTSIDSLTGSLCPPPEVFDGHEVSVPIYLARRDGKSTASLLHFFPLIEDQKRVASVLGVITPITAPAPTVGTSPAVQLHAELTALRITLRQKYGVTTLVCRSESMMRVLEQSRMAIQSNTAVLLQGEPGTGKEHIARLIHYESEAARRSFVPLDCRRSPSYELKRTLGRLFEPDPDESSTVPALQAGTLYLVDVDHLPRDFQTQIVKALRPDNSHPPVQLRLIAATTSLLEQAVEEDRILPELYYLLTPLQIQMPALRQRSEDLSMLAQHFLENLNRSDDNQIGGFADDVWEQFQRYNWPGNLNELVTVIEEAREVCTSEMIRVKDLPYRFRTGLDAQSVGPTLAPKPVPLEPLLARIEKEHIERALQQSRQNKSKAAELLGLTRARLYRRMEALGIEDLE
jgi:DNA-binding NtrC family response regulator